MAAILLLQNHANRGSRCGAGQAPRLRAVCLSAVLSLPLCPLDRLLLEKIDRIRGVARVSDILCMSNLVHASKLKEHEDNDDYQ